LEWQTDILFHAEKDVSFVSEGLLCKPQLIFCTCVVNINSKLLNAIAYDLPIRQDAELGGFHRLKVGLLVVSGQVMRGMHAVS
jgi:hypothetical protein